ncbi:MAG TPA: acyl carrier protein [Candidatus Acidoferrales bacterium]|nr:acyl carrier protein [Candidatus Acidoferrales bacterium]
MPEVVRDKVLSIAADVLSVSPALLSDRSSSKTVESWDSIRHLNLILALEDSFALQFAPEEMEQMETIGQIASLVEAKLAEAGKA